VTIIEIDNAADIATKLLNDGLEAAGYGKYKTKISHAMASKLIIALAIETPKCEECHKDQLMIFNNCGDQSIYRCPVCGGIVDFELWLTGIRTKSVLAEHHHSNSV